MITPLEFRTWLDGYLSLALELKQGPQLKNIETIKEKLNEMDVNIPKNIPSITPNTVIPPTSKRSPYFYQDR